MDDLTNGETSPGALLARLATLPPPDELRAHLVRREQLRDDWVQRAHDWAVARAGGRSRDVEIVYPRDTEAVIALGVPCGDCFGLVYAEGQGGHHVRFGFEAGRHWAALVTASCKRPPA
jgi:hypothetical protein